MVENPSDRDELNKNEQKSPQVEDQTSELIQESHFEESPVAGKKFLKAGDRTSRTSELLEEGELEESELVEEFGKRTAPIGFAESIYLDDSLGELANTRSLLDPKLNARLPTIAGIFATECLGIGVKDF